MRIKKFISINNVGRLVNCTQKGPELSKYNLFFAENGRGKTTLCAVLRSLKTGRHEYMTERKTISPTPGEPNAVIRLNDNEARYQNQTWNMTVPEIAIFDATFVAKNVHAGEYVNRDHRTNLLQVIVGETGVALAKKVTDLDTAIRDKNNEINRSRKSIEAQLPRGIKVDDFLKLVEDSDVESKIKAKSAELKTAKEADTIKKKGNLVGINIPTLPENLLPILAKTLDDVSADAEKLLKEHINQHNMHNKGEAWISEGLGYLNNDACPFCGQNTKGLGLVDAYKQYFSEAYAKFIAEIEQISGDVETALGDATLASIARTIATNEASMEFWKQHTEIKVSAPDHDTIVVANTVPLREAIEALLEKKRSRPLDAITPDATFKTAQTNQQAAADALKDYNASIKEVNTTIDKIKKEAENANVATVQKALELLQLTELRYSTKVKPLCNEHLKLISNKTELDKEKDTAKKSLDKHADQMIGDYETTINKLLKGFGAGFTITNSKKSYIGGTATTAYQILINNHPVSLGDESTPIGEPSFRTTLSAGDKSTLALAFFLAKLDHDPNKANRIIVFDDPFNSQDRSRRERTAELLKKYGNECFQILLLSHDPFFLSLVFSKLPKAERHCLQLSRVPDNNTTIEEWDVEKETQDGYFKEHAALNSYLLNGAKEIIDIARKIRPVLEGYLRYRFPNQFPDKEWLGDMIKRIRDEGAQHPMYDALEELEGINDYSKKYHHDTNPGKADSEPINDGELTTFVERTLVIAGGY